MAIFKCMNCGVLIKKKIIRDPRDEKIEITCPKCRSRWIEYYCPDADITPYPIGEMVYNVDIE